MVIKAIILSKVSPNSIKIMIRSYTHLNKVYVMNSKEIRLWI